MDIIWTDTLIFKVFAILGVNLLAAVGTLSSAYIVFLIKDKREMKKTGEYSWDLQTSDEEIINFKLNDLKQRYRRSLDINMQKKQQEEIAITNKKKYLDAFTPGIKLSIINNHESSDDLKSNAYPETCYTDSEKYIESSIIESNDQLEKGKQYTKETKKYY